MELAKSSVVIKDNIYQIAANIVNLLVSCLLEMLRCSLSLVI